MPFKSEIIISEQQIQKIIARFFPKLQLIAITEIKESFVNPVYELLFEDDLSYILKINNPQWPNKQLREINAMRITKEKTSIPIPDVVVTDYEKNIIPYYYAIYEKTQGKELRILQRENSLNSTEYLSIVKELGYFLGQLHSINFDFFGDILTKKKAKNESDGIFWGRRFNNWRSCFKAICLDNLNWVDTTSFKEYRTIITSEIDSIAERINDPKNSSFIHSDIQPSNIIINNGKITGILDFEWTYAGSASFELELILAGLSFSNFPSLDASTINKSYPSLNNKQIESNFFSGYKETFKGDIERETINLAEFIYLLYMIGSWDWILKTSAQEEIQEHKLAIDTIFEKFF